MSVKHDIAQALIEHRGESIRLLKAELAQAKADRDVLAKEVLEWRRWGMAEVAGAATDASGALERAGGK
jgi:hypothetical protein